MILLLQCLVLVEAVNPAYSFNLTVNLKEVTVKSNPKKKGKQLNRLTLFENDLEHKLTTMQITQ